MDSMTAGGGCNCAIDIDNVWQAASQGNVQRVKGIIKRHNNNANMRDKFGYTAIIAAASAGKLKVLDQLIELGADIDAQTNGGATALMRAAYNGHVHIVQRLLEANCNINLKDSDGLTALDKAVKMARHEVEELLRKHPNTVLRE